MFVVASHATFDEALERVGSGNTSTLAADLLATGRFGQKKIFLATGRSVLDSIDALFLLGVL